MDQEWVFAVFSACQRLIAETFDAPAASVTASLQSIMVLLPVPSSAIEMAFLRATLLDVAIRWTQDRHRRLHDGQTSTRCGDEILARALEFWQDSTRDARELFARHVEFVAWKLQATHGQALARYAAAYLEQNFTRRLDMGRLAKLLSAHPTTIRRAFRRAYGMTPGEYLRSLRVAEASRQRSQAHEKVEALAWKLGWRSKRGLYQARRKHTLKPSEAVSHSVNCQGAILLPTFHSARTSNSA
jgi:transcriptional regulator GlxA family with amidase domain